MHKPQPAHIYEFGDFRIDRARRLLFGADGLSRSLSPKAFDTLLYLVEHSEMVLDKESLMKAIWPDTVVEENNLNQNISILRRVLGGNRHQNRYILTVPGHGYRFIAAVQKHLDEASRLAGAPLSMMLVEQGLATVTICHKYTEDLQSFTKKADILISAVGKPGLITADMVKDGAVVTQWSTTPAGRRARFYSLTPPIKNGSPKLSGSGRRSPEGWPDC